ncbi:4Fe-4S ferredoxin [Candidatus Parcubacteria bacterium]|nr:MAG: 4Fe-4S ferredoxin [Candidatus Parcubacteria bacterium]
MPSQVDLDKCIGCGACVAMCPAGFKLGANGKSEVIDPNSECAEKAKDACPVQAITV